MKILKHISSYSVLLLINTLLFFTVNNNFPSLVSEANNSLLNSITNIQPSFSLSISFFIYPLLITFVTILVKTVLYDKTLIKNDPIEIIKNYLLLTIIILFSFLFVTYLLRFLNFPRSFFIFYIFISPLSVLIYDLFERFILNLKKPKLNITSYLLIIIMTSFLISILLNDSNLTSVEYENTETEAETQFEYVLDSLTENRGCFIFAGSDIDVNCFENSTTELIGKYEEKFNNIVKYNDDFLLLTKDGKVYKYLEDDIDLILNFDEKVYYKPDGYSETGLLGLAFHPEENFFLVSYTNNEVSLILEKVNYEGSIENILESEILYSIPTNVGGHFSGTVIWSDYFQGFLFAIGDMESSDWGIFESDPLNTTSPKGKVLLFQSDIKFKSPKLTLNSDAKILDNVVAYGLRNPWQIFEFENKLFIPDVGLSTYEEINIINYSDYLEKGQQESKNFGWPLFEGPQFVTELPLKNKSQLVPDNTKDNLELLYIEENNYSSAYDYVVQTLEEPDFYYNHNPSPTSPYYRSAIIGSDVFKSSEYGTRFVFTDYMSKEIFLFDYDLNKLDIFMLSENILGQPVAIKTFSSIDKTFLIVTTFGEILKISIP